jgi:hypothetical protein
MTSAELEAAKVTINTITEALKADVERALVLAAMVRRANSQVFVATFKNTHEAHGLTVSRDALIHSLVLVLTRMFDPGPNARNPKRGTNRASLEHLVLLLGSEEVRNSYGADARDWPGKPHLSDRNEKLVLSRIRRGLRHYHRLVNSDAGARWLKGLRDFRDQHLAHTLFGTQGKEKLLYGYMDHVLSRVTPIVDDLVLALLGHNVDHSGTKEAWRRHANAYWQTVQLGVAARRTMGKTIEDPAVVELRRKLRWRKRARKDPMA